jgi:hypothetical protein
MRAPPIRPKPPYGRAGRWLTGLAILRNAHHAAIRPEKLTRYCLDPTSPRGRDKARVFKAALGFDLSNHIALIEAIQRGILVFESLPETPML